jgi:hypothetical protein
MEASRIDWELSSFGGDITIRRHKYQFRNGDGREVNGEGIHPGRRRVSALNPGRGNLSMLYQ